MIFIKLNREGSVVETHHRPFDKTCGLGKTKEQLELEGILVENIPEPQTIEGKREILKWDFLKKELYYEYISRELTTEEELEILKTENAELKVKQDLIQQAIDDLLLVGGAL